MDGIHTIGNRTSYTLRYCCFAGALSNGLRDVEQEELYIYIYIYWPCMEYSHEPHSLSCVLVKIDGMWIMLKYVPQRTWLSFIIHKSWKYDVASGCFSMSSRSKNIISFTSLTPFYSSSTRLICSGYIPVDILFLKKQINLFRPHHGTK